MKNVGVFNTSSPQPMSEYFLPLSTLQWWMINKITFIFIIIIFSVLSPQICSAYELDLVAQVTQINGCARVWVLL